MFLIALNETGQPTRYVPKNVNLTSPYASEYRGAGALEFETAALARDWMFRIGHSIIPSIWPKARHEIVEIP